MIENKKAYIRRIAAETVEEIDLAMLSKSDAYAAANYYKKELDRYVHAAIILESLDGKSFLDVGCGRGHVPVIASKLGKTVSAVEYDKRADGGEAEAFRELMARYSVTFRSTGDLCAEKLPFPDESFDIVSCFAVIEHFHHSPRFALLEMKRVLRPGGFLVLETPNSGQLFKRLYYLFKGTQGGFERFWNWEYPYLGHVREYNPSEMRKMFRKLGLTVHSIKSISSLREYGSLLSPYGLISRVLYPAVLLNGNYRSFIFCVGRKAPPDKQ